jgi:hypothetical protein
MLRKAAFLAGLFLLCGCVLILQIVETRILSVISFYHLAFFAISMAMFGMTGGALIVYFNQDFFAPERLLAHLSWIAAAFALTAVLSTVVLISTVLLNWPVRLVLSAMLWLKLIVGLLPPYLFAGMGISLALTRSCLPIGQVYGSDLAGASLGCLGALILMSTLDGVSAMLMVGALHRRRLTRTGPAHVFLIAGTGMPGIFTLKDPIMVRLVKNSVFQSSPPKPILVVAGWPWTMRPSFLPFGSST